MNHHIYEAMSAAADEYGVEITGGPAAFVAAIDRATAAPRPRVDWRSIPFRQWRRALDREWSRRHPAEDPAENPAGRDARLLIPVHVAGWSPWKAASCIHHWLRWWDQCATRPKTVGSSYNIPPEKAWVLWQHDVRPPAAGGWAEALVRADGQLLDGRRRQRAIRLLATRTAKMPAGVNGPLLSSLRTADLLRLARLSGAFVRWLFYNHNPLYFGVVDWKYVAAAHKEWAAAHATTRGAYNALCVPAHTRVHGADFGSVPALVAVAMADAGWRFQSGWWRRSGRKQQAKFGLLLKAPWAEDARKWVSSCDSEMGEGWGAPLLTRLVDAAEHKWAIPAGAFVSCPQLQEALDALDAKYNAAPVDVDTDMAQRLSRQSVHRAADRLAQRRPQYAVTAYGYEYARGVRIAPLCAVVHQQLAGLLEDGKTVFIHGRDGELHYELLRRDPRWSRWAGRVRYGITSRPLTTGGGGGPEYRQYLERVLPKDVPAWHVDTGFAGSIPEWMAREGWTVEGVWLISSNRTDWQMPGTAGFSGLRDVVLGDLEHAAQRLDQLSHTSWDRGLNYAASAAGFWARLYGVADKMGLPRRI